MPRRNHDGTFIYTPEEHAYAGAAHTQKQFTDEIFNDPELNDDARRLINRKHPNLDQGTWSSEQRLKAEIAALRKEKEDEKKAAEDAKRTDRWQQRKDAAQKKYGLTDEAMGKVEQIMKDEEIYSYEEAAQTLTSREPKPIEATMNNHYWNYEKQDGFKDIAADPEKWGFNTLFKDVSRLQQKQRNEQF